ncbi:MAG: peptide chain release factor N(5)-glutamine methyltransferase [Mariprofundales bacterium]|nr:peptide chain release factor N(5)-glutamine methyltransferase [Mariprofundales bacterium]
METTTTLRNAGCSSEPLDARLLLQQATDLDQLALITAMESHIGSEQLTALETMVERRCQREPIAYILGYRHFWRHRFKSDRRALIPRPETEHLIETLLTLFPDKRAPLRLCDIATGSGCLAISIALEYPNATVVATDISTDALALAAHNCQQLDATEQITLLQGDLLAALPECSAPFDAIISNPPYVSSEEMDDLEPELSYEPTIALTDGGDGLSLLRQLLQDSPHHLHNRGYLLAETGVCGLPPLTDETPLTLKEEIIDLAGRLRGGVWQHNSREPQ